jgi:hypothetical protein
LGPIEKVLPEDGDRIQSPKLYVLKYKQDGVLNKNRTMDNVQKHNICNKRVDKIKYLGQYIGPSSYEILGLLKNETGVGTCQTRQPL